MKVNECQRALSRKKRFNIRLKATAPLNRIYQTSVKKGKKLRLYFNLTQRNIIL